MSDNVISIGTKKPLQDDIREMKKAERVHQTNLDAAATLHKTQMLELIDNIRRRIEANEIEGFCFAGRNPNNGAFLSTIILNNAATRVDGYLAYSGILGAMQIDMTDMANSGPHMNPDGSYFALGDLDDIEFEGE